MRQQLIDLRRKMEERRLDAYLIPTTDFHGSEYVNDYFKCRKYVSGFTGSAGTLLVMGERAYLWTDGRYFLQAAQQLEGSGIELMKSGQPGVPSIEAYLEEAFPDGCRLGFDGRVADDAFASGLGENIQIFWEEDLVDKIWEDRPALSSAEVWPVPESVTGESADAKISRVRKAMAEKEADYLLLTGLEEIAWLFNLRGSDVENTPVFYAFALVEADRLRLYTMRSRSSFEGAPAEIMPYMQIFEDLKTVRGRIWIDRKTASFAAVKSLPEDTEIYDALSPVMMMKALKNPVEIQSTRSAHIKDGVAMVQFLYWIKTGIGKIPMSEISAADYLRECRFHQEGCFDLSFGTIAGYGANGAIIHYGATEETSKTLKPEGFLLMDSGGQYRDGTTDITRTIALGPLTEQMKAHYTAVLKCHITLARSKFPAGTTGSELDAVTRKPLQALGLDYNHGTGHGVGHILSCHEGPQSISPRGTAYPIYPGMICSDEPGVYLAGEYGIRLENEILCICGEDGRYGFEPITFCPFDREAVLPELLTEEELDWLNGYHSRVYVVLSPLLEPEPAAWLKEQTKPFKKPLEK